MNQKTTQVSTADFGITFKQLQLFFMLWSLSFSYSKPIEHLNVRAFSWSNFCEHWENGWVF
jgi:hypothetical protein